MFTFHIFSFNVAGYAFTFSHSLIMTSSDNVGVYPFPSSHSFIITLVDDVFQTFHNLILMMDDKR